MANNKEMLQSFLKLYSKKAVRMEIQFNDGTSEVFTDYYLATDVIETIKSRMAAQLKMSYCKEPKLKKQKNENNAK